MRIRDATVDDAEAVARVHLASWQGAHLWALVGNARARHVYERDGWVSDGTVQREEVLGVERPEVRYTLEL